MEFLRPFFPTVLHAEAAKAVNDFFVQFQVDTVLIVNSCARGHASAESDLDMAILVEKNYSLEQQEILNQQWIAFANENSTINKYKNSSLFAHLHVEIINGTYNAGIIQNGEPIDYFEVEIGNQLRYSIQVNTSGSYYKYLQQKLLPYYDEKLRIERLNKLKEACFYNIDQIAILVKRELYFNAFDVLYQALQKYLQALFIANKAYPIAYNKWINYQLIHLLKKPELYATLTSVLSLKNITSNEIVKKASILNSLLKRL